ncbi:MAG: hypothetical protein K0R38_6138 [Polyangiaceae bacterium]|nr:hypothetical protein [Polyangiaceae bacterium]
MVEITLPARPDDDAPDSRGVTLRIPEQGGLPEPGSDLPRGLLLLTVVPSSEPDSRIRLLRGVPSKRPPAVVERDEMPSHRAGRASPRRVSPGVVIVGLVVVVWVLLLIWLRLSGRG